MLLPALNLGGIPPLSGFLGKLLLLEAAAEIGGFMPWLLIGGAVLTSLLTLYTMTIVWSKAFWRDRSDAPDGEMAFARPRPLTENINMVPVSERPDVGRMPWGMVLPTSLLVAASLSVTLLAGPISGVTGRSAESAQDVNHYRDAVLGTTADNPGRTLPGKEAK